MNQSDVPTGWEGVELKEVLLSVENGSRPQGGVDLESGDIPSLGGENILQEGGVLYHPVNKVHLDFFKEMTKGILKDKDVLINKDGANTGKIGLYSAKYYKEAAINEHLFILRGKPHRITQEYLYYLLASEEGSRKIRDRITGSAQPGLNSRFTKKFYVRIPTLIEEQSKITATLQTIDNAIQKTRELIEKHKKVKQGLMQDLFMEGKTYDRPGLGSGAYELPLGWVPTSWVAEPLGKITLKVADRDHYTPIYLESGIPMISPTDFDELDRISFANCRYVSLREHLKNKRKTDIRTDDLIFTRIGALLGKACIVTEDMPEFSILHSAAMIRADTEKILPKFLLYSIKTDYVQREILDGIQSIGVPDLGLDKIKKLTIKYPKVVDEQTKLVSALSSADDKIESEYHYLAKLNKIKSGLSQDLLTGKVRVAA